jgi:hypothetical protein
MRGVVRLGGEPEDDEGEGAEDGEHTLPRDEPGVTAVGVWEEAGNGLWRL